MCLLSETQARVEHRTALRGSRQAWHAPLIVRVFDAENKRGIRMLAYHTQFSDRPPLSQANRAVGRGSHEWRSVAHIDRVLDGGDKVVMRSKRAYCGQSMLRKTLTTFVRARNRSFARWPSLSGLYDSM